MIYYRKKAGKVASKVLKTLNPFEARKEQLKFLLNWKSPEINNAECEKEYKYIEFDDILTANLDKSCKEIECILINPPWSVKSPKFDFQKFVY